MNMTKKTRAPRTRLDSITTSMRELSSDELEKISGGFRCGPFPDPDDWTETWPKHDTDLMDID